mmetsp:Transcript_6600/g.12070  ORF Transcript_6600/g.12070 Transcript_6600/m.12070 type:complete len:403 (+) Transcript_6600:35-1243(+)
MTVEQEDTRKMVSGTTMVEVSNEDLCLVLARAIGTCDPAKVDLEKSLELLVAQGKATEVVTALLDSVQALLSKASPSDAESGMSILAHAIAKLPEENCEAFASKFVSAATAASTSEDQTDLTLAVLVRAYNTFPPSSKARFNTLVACLDFAVSKKKTHGLASALKGSSEVIKKEFKLEGDDFRVFLLALSKVYAKGGKDTYDILTQYLMTFAPAGGKDIKTDPNATDIAKRAVVELIKCPQLFKCDFFEAVKGLEGLSSFGKVFELTKAVVESDVKKLDAFCGSNKTVLSDLGVTAEQCIDKVRLLALASMGAAAQSKAGEILYSDVKASLDIPEDEVELWLIKAIGLKILDGRMDQLHQTFKVQKTAYKAFGGLEWSTLNDKLGKMDANISNVQTKLKTRK